MHFRNLLLLVPAAAAAKCGMAASDPQYQDFVANTTQHLPGWSTVDLDMPAVDRWTHIVTPVAKDMQVMINTFKQLAGKVSQDIFALLELLSAKKVDELVDAMPKEYGDEIRGISKATGIKLAEVFFYNIAYEIEGACTSLVGQDAAGNLVHGRNLDFGLFFGWNTTEHQWRLTDALRPLLQNVRFIKGGETVFNATVFAGYVGLLTGMKTGSFSITVNTRFDGTLWKGLRDWISGADRTGHFLSFLTRDSIMLDTTFDQAVERINSTKLLGPAYMIVGGVKPGEGAIVTRSHNESLHFVSLKDAQAAGKNYILQTNYDNWVKAPFFDDRRTPGQKCMEQVISEQKVDFGGVFQVLSAIPTRNRLTTYSTLMSVHDGRMEAYYQHCPEAHCAVWMSEATLV